MGCCYSCTEDENSQSGEPSERTHLLGDPVSNNTNIQRVNSDSFLSQYPNSLPKKTDEQSALNRILQETATNVIDVAALDSHNLEQHEYVDRMKQYVQRVQRSCVGGATHVPDRPCLLVDVASPEKILSSEPVDRADWESTNSYVARAASAIGELRVEHKEDLVVPFRIP